jgi:hypothetical protein
MRFGGAYLPASFKIRGPFVVPLVKNKRLVKPGCPEFWSKPKVDKLSDQCGCYVFAMRAGKGITPIYVGKATKTFKQECFADSKIARHYGPALLDYKRGRPVLFLVVLERTRGKVNKRAIAKVDFFSSRPPCRRTATSVTLKAGE